jgi:tetratricopeptide (TPR) repeat protein
VSPAAHSNLAAILWFAGHFEASMAMAEKAAELNAAYFRAYEDLGRACEQTGALDRAVAAFEKAIALEPSACETLASLGHAYALAGRTGDARAVLRRLKTMAQTRLISSYAFALVHLALGEIDEAFVYLDRAADERSSSMPFIDVNPRLAPLRADPRFAALRRKVGLA